MGILESDAAIGQASRLETHKSVCLVLHSHWNRLSKVRQLPDVLF